MYIHKNPAHAPLTSPPSLSGSAGGGGHCGNARHIIYIIIHHTFQRFRLQSYKKIQVCPKFSLIKNVQKNEIYLELS